LNADACDMICLRSHNRTTASFNPDPCGSV
jgi:hypothetical protein